MRFAGPRAVQAVIEAVSAHSGFSVEDLIGHSRNRPLTYYRQVAMYVVRSQIQWSHPMIAEYFDGRDHTTVVHACRRVAGNPKAMALCVKIWQDAQDQFDHPLAEIVDLASQRAERAQRGTA